MTEPNHAVLALRAPGATAEELETADLLAELDEIHTRDGRLCVGCAEVWPCAAVEYALDETLLAVMRAHNRRANSPPPRPVSLIRRPKVRRPLLELVDPDERLEPLSSDQTVLDARRAEAVTPTYCRDPDCRQVISVAHPLTEGWQDHVVCDRHRDSTRNRYADLPTMPDANPQLTPGRCASCEAAISTRAEWCCEPCAVGRGHADTCATRERKSA